MGDATLMKKYILAVSNEQWPDAEHWGSTSKQHIQMLGDKAKTNGHDILNETDHGDKHLHDYTTIPVYYAIFYGAKPSVVEFMLEANREGSRDWRSVEGSTLLHVAAWRNHHAVVPMLLYFFPEHAANRNSNGVLPLDLAINFKCQESEQHLRDVVAAASIYARTRTTKMLSKKVFVKAPEADTKGDDLPISSMSPKLTSLRQDGHDRWTQTTVTDVENLLSGRPQELNETYGGWLPLVNAVLFGAPVMVCSYMYDRMNEAGKEKLRAWRGLKNRTLLYYTIYDQKNHHLIELVTNWFPEYLMIKDQQSRILPVDLAKKMWDSTNNGDSIFERLLLAAGEHPCQGHHRPCTDIL